MEIKSQYNVLSLDCDWVGSVKHVTELLPFIIPILNNNKKIIFDYDHHNINKHFNLTFDECNLFNIDHHHDAGYKQDRQALDEGNWLWHLIQAFPKKINYRWIANTNSFPLSTDFFVDYFNNLIKSYKFDYNVNCISQTEFDTIFICCSPNYNNEFGLAVYKILESIYETPRSH